LKKSFELEDSFKSLNHIPRSEIQKRKTFHNIIQNGRPKKNFHEFLVNWTSVLLTVTMLLISSGFLYTQIINPVNIQQSAVEPADHFTGGTVVRTYLTKSKSENYFTLQNNLTRPGITILEDKIWMSAINDTLIGMAAVTNPPKGKVLYDFLVLFEGREPAECKLWIYESEVYIMQLENEQVYKVDSQDADLIIKTVEDIEKRVLF
jgi:hypothetical protein